MNRHTRARLWRTAELLAPYCTPVFAVLFGAGLAVLILWRF